MARRAAAALPALGREGGVQPVPSSARATVDRRRRAAAKAAGGGPGKGPVESATSEPVEALATGEGAAQPLAGSGSRPAGPVVDEAAPPDPPGDRGLPGSDRPAPAPDAPAPEQPAPEPDLGEPERVDAESQLARPVPKELDAEPAAAQSDPEATEPGPAAAGQLAAILGQPGDPNPRHLRDDDGQTPQQQPVGADAATSTVVALADLGTDEWIPVGRAAELVGAATLADAGAARAGETVRPGPLVLADPDAGPRTDAYHGRRRAQAATARSWWVIGLVVLGLGGAVGIPYLVNRTSATTQTRQPPVMSPAPLAIEAVPSGEFASATSSAAASSTPTPAPTSQPVIPPPPPTSSSTSAPPQPVSLTLEAEDVPPSARPNTQVDANPNCYPNGPEVVSWIGRWSTSGSPGAITFAVSVPSAGTYMMTVHYINTTETRLAEITVNGAAPISPWPTFPNTEDPPTCVDARAPIAVSLQAGDNTIRFGNPMYRAPTIDKIVITQA